MAALFPHYHVGIVVADLERSMAEYAELFGIEWHAPLPVASTLHDPGGAESFISTMVYSIQGPPYMELLQRQPNSPWSEPGLHHLGLWATEVPRESDRLTAAGLPRIISASDPATGAPFAYHQTVDGVRLELIDLGKQGPAIATYLSGALDEELRRNASAAR